jgi:DNA-binding NarL/FixJ family response regulator
MNPKLTHWGDGMNQLTRQEQKIVALIAQGLTNKEIAQRLDLSVFTVRNQVKVIMRKLELEEPGSSSLLERTAGEHY